MLGAIPASCLQDRVLSCQRQLLAPVSHSPNSEKVRLLSDDLVSLFARSQVRPFTVPGYVLMLIVDCPVQTSEKPGEGTGSLGRLVLQMNFHTCQISWQLLHLCLPLASPLYSSPIAISWG